MIPHMRAMKHISLKRNLFSGVFYVELVATPTVSEGFRHARAHVARMVLFDRGSCNGYVRHARASGPRGLLGQEG